MLLLDVLPDELGVEAVLVLDEEESDLDVVLVVLLALAGLLLDDEPRLSFR
ncbi:hypothetical protein SMD11_4018 [Streptomyces albireticuli]|uniref:Uncharacterized protein n=1 Tax=Streptomyces albireticuli TaxID=1940 RepID=A0A1Z2L5R1_9ACTN|nr:hypothetical protein SMD11_4018 [Streptomyces albireticuli]